MSSRELKQASGQLSRQASKLTSRWQAGKQASRKSSRQASTRKAFSRSHALEGLVENRSLERPGAKIRTTLQALVLKGNSVLKIVKVECDDS